MGALPTLVALTLTPAKKYPWQTLPVLILATLIGYVLAMLLELATDDAVFNTFAGTVAFWLIPAATGLLMAANVDRLPAALRLGAKSR